MTPGRCTDSEFHVPLRAGPAAARQLRSGYPGPAVRNHRPSGDDRPSAAKAFCGRGGAGRSPAVGWAVSGFPVSAPDSGRRPW